MPLALERLARSLYANRRLIWQLAVHDLRARYAASSAGMAWAILQPAVVIVVFWFVSAYGLRLGESGQPFFLVLFCGLVPWMTFSDALTGGTGAVLAHGYLVKKIAFPVEVLPVVTAVSATIVHAFLVALLVVILLVSGVPVTAHWLGAAYFLLAMLAFSTGLAWLLSALNAFSRDVGHGLGAVVTVWFWMTPIVWPVDNLTGLALRIVQLNPLFYVVEGYRNAFLHARPVWALWPLDLYFWAVTGTALVVGATVFRRLRPHFAEVL